MSDLSDDSAVEDGFVNEVLPLATQKRKLFPVNNVEGLEEKLNELQLKLDWVEKLDIAVDGADTNEFAPKKKDTNDDSTAENDFKREMSFYNQALAGVSKAFKRLKKLGIPTKRPDDYFAEMAKSDAHMLKVREKLLSKQTIVERTEKARALREQKKQGKKIQREIIQQRKQEKKKMITALKKTKKGKMGADKLLDEKKQGKENKRKRNRDYRDSRYGFGGKKKGTKYNTAESSAVFHGDKSKGANHNRGPNNKSFNNKKNFGKQRMSRHRRRR